MISCGCSSMVEFQPSKLAVWVRSPSPAPSKKQETRDKRQEKGLLRGGAVWLARRAHNPEVAGSNPVPATNSRGKRQETRGRKQDVCSLILRGGAVWLARRAHNPEVAGSNPVPATNADVAQSVEHILGKDEVTGSIPVVSSILIIYPALRPVLRGFFVVRNYGMSCSTRGCV